jgi:acyl-CoA thioester hydrolase
VLVLRRPICEPKSAAWRRFSKTSPTSELLAGEIVEIRSRFLEVRDKALRFVHEMRNAETGEVAAICEITAGHIDRRARKAVALPATIRDAANATLAPGMAAN